MPWKKNEKNIYGRMLQLQIMVPRNVRDKVFSRKNSKIELLFLKCNDEKD